MSLQTILRVCSVTHLMTILLKESYIHERDERLAGSEQINYDCVNSVTVE